MKNSYLPSTHVSTHHIRSIPSSLPFCPLWIHISNIKFPLKIFNVDEIKKRKKEKRKNAKVQKKIHKNYRKKIATNKKINLNQYNNIKSYNAGSVCSTRIDWFASKISWLPATSTFFFNDAKITKFFFTNEKRVNFFSNPCCSHETEKAAVEKKSQHK